MSNIESIQMQLASCQAALADTEALEIGTSERLVKVEQQLAAAIAACKLKDEAMKFVYNNARDPFTAEKELRKALAIQPDDAALGAWLGEPVARINSNGIVVIEDKTLLDGVEWLELYKPKGLK